MTALERLENAIREKEFTVGFTYPANHRVYLDAIRVEQEVRYTVILLKRGNRTGKEYTFPPDTAGLGKATGTLKGTLTKPDSARLRQGEFQNGRIKQSDFERTSLTAIPLPGVMMVSKSIFYRKKYEIGTV